MTLYHGYKASGFRLPSSEAERERYMYFHCGFAYKALPAALTMDPLSTADALLSSKKDDVVAMMLAALGPYPGELGVHAGFSGRHLSVAMHEIQGRPCLVVTMPPAIEPSMCVVAAGVVSPSKLRSSDQERAARYFSCEIADKGAAVLCERYQDGQRFVLAELPEPSVEEFLGRLAKQRF
jgi:hypothetical protein